MHPSVGSSGLGTSCSPSPPKSVLSQSAPADVNAFTFLHCDMSAADSVGYIQVKGCSFFVQSLSKYYICCFTVDMHILMNELMSLDHKCQCTSVCGHQLLHD